MSRPEIKQVSFSLFNADEIERLGAVHITDPSLDIAEGKNLSLYSSQMGPFRQMAKCPICNKSSPNCFGHYGRIEFPTRSRSGVQIYIIHEGYLPTIISLLQSICKKCGTPLLYGSNSEEFSRLRGEKRLKAIAEASLKIDTCRASAVNANGQKITCCGQNPVYYNKAESTGLRGNFIRYHIKSEGGSHLQISSMPKMYPYEMYDLFHLLEVEPKYLEFLGFSPGIDPKNMLLRNILVLPPSIRPPIVRGDKVTHNDLTNMYIEIIRYCVRLRGTASQGLELTLDQEEAVIDLLYGSVSALFNNSKGRHKYASAGGKAHRTIKALITGKGRLIRGHIQGKRVNYCARSVASPNPNLRLNQVGLPEALAKILTHPEIVTAQNMERLQGYVDNGLVNFITKARGRYKDRSFTVSRSKGDRTTIERLSVQELNAKTPQEQMLIRNLATKTLELDDIVDRQIMGARREKYMESILENGLAKFVERYRDIPGDMCLVNRQPTLHKMSMMGMEIVIVKELTIQMSVNVCGPFGLDFDGDELNLHFPQTPASIAELAGRMSVDQCIVSPQHNRPVVGLTQDSLTSVFLMTKSGVVVSRNDFQSIAYSAQLSEKVESLMERVYRSREAKGLSHELLTLRRDELEKRWATIVDASRTNAPALYGVAVMSSREMENLMRRARLQLAAFQHREDYLATLTAALTPTLALSPEIPHFQQADFEAWSYQQFLESRAAQLSEKASESDYREWLRALDDPRITNAQVTEKQLRSLLAEDLREEFYLTGRELFSLLLPEQYFYSKRNNADALQPIVQIHKGILLQGTIDKAIVGATNNSIIHDLYKLYSPALASDFISRAKWLADPWLKLQGFTVSLRDCLPNDNDFEAKVSAELSQAKERLWRAGPRSSNPFQELKRQELMRSELASVKNVTNSMAMKAIYPNNSIAAMVESGSKGSKANFGSILTIVGAQESQGRPIPALPGGRTIPAYELNTRDPAATGFVENSYLKGLTPGQFFYHQVASREGLLGTSTKTAETGYLQRRLVKTLEDAVAYPDGTVRSIVGNVIQYAYGEDGFAGEKLIVSNGKSVFLNIRKLIDEVVDRRKNDYQPMFTPYVESELQYEMPTFAGAGNKKLQEILDEDELDDEDHQDAEAREAEEKEDAQGEDEVEYDDDDLGEDEMVNDNDD